MSQDPTAGEIAHAGVIERIEASDQATIDPLDVLGDIRDANISMAVVSSFQASGLVIMHMLNTLGLSLPVFFLDTGFHFEETLRFQEEVTRRWSLDVRVLRGRHGSVQEQERVYGADLHATDPDRCCTINKVEPLQDVLENFDGWISGLRRDQSTARSSLGMVGYQVLPSGRRIAKVHPLAHWTRRQVDAYLDHHGVATHPLLERGFESVGCWPCTRFMGPHEEKRAGRWFGMDKTECGIHTEGLIVKDP